MTDCPMTCEVKEQLDAILANLEAIKEGFPKDREGQPDIVGHRRGHEAEIAAAKAKERFYEELRLDLVKKGVWGILLVLVGLILAGVAAKLGLGQSLSR